MPDQITKPHSIYLDHAATTPLSPAVKAAMLPYLDEHYGNPSSLHHLGRQAKAVLSTARSKIAGCLEVEPNEIIFTGSGTESDNLAILGLARANRHRGRHVMVSSIEHKAVLNAAKQLEREGFQVTYLPVDEHGLVSVDQCLGAITNDTCLISIMYANNEIGTIEPIETIASEIKLLFDQKHRPLIHTDACQAVGLLPVSPVQLGVDAMTINSSKIYGPKGTGLLYLRTGVPIEPMILGGDQERGLRAGTENVALAVGFATALEEAIRNTANHAAHMQELSLHFTKKLKQQLPQATLNGHPEKRLPNNVHITIPEIEGESLILMLDEYGICVATGSACSSLDLEPSYVLSAIGQDENIIHGSLRFTFGRSTTKADLDHTVAVLSEITGRLLNISAMTTSAYRELV